MRLSQQRANAVRTALLQTGKLSAQQIETRWTGERQQGAQTASDVADPSNRAVDIGVH
jgi:outer membrane protein OmpA-like peptidoglycan-associated protein